MRSFRELLRSRFPFFRWPLQSYPQGVDLTPPNEGLELHVNATRHSLRLQRYWWAARAIEDEARESQESKVIVIDLGCERGWVKRFVQPSEKLHWIGLDGYLGHPSLAASRYDETIEADFNKTLPVPDGVADVVVSLHVFEHLADPGATLKEVSRVLKPNGLFLVGTPVNAAPLAGIRTLALQARQRAGKNRPWGHLRKFSPPLWGELCRESGLRLQFLTGSHLMRHTGFFLENFRWWIRLNQLWGSLFPSWGSEVYLSARKTTDPGAAGVNPLTRLWLSCEWAAPVLLVAFCGWIFLGAVASTRAHPLADDIAFHQDGNDVFKWCSLAGLDDPKAKGNVEPLRDVAELDEAFDLYRQRGKDLHVVIRETDALAYLRIHSSLQLHVAAQWAENGQRFLVLSQESQHVHLAAWTAAVPQ